jgi:hypothetical protein
MPKDDILAQKALQNTGQSNYSAGVTTNRGIFPAIVVPNGTNDNSEQNRIRARIVNVQEDGKIQGKSNSANEENYNSYAGKDRGITDETLVLCIPLLPEFFHIRPQVGEMVFVLMENPQDVAGVRYWIGPIISSKLKLKFQSYEDSFKMFNKTDSITNAKINSSIDLSTIFPGNADVAVQGRDDADLILKSREVLLIAGKLSSSQTQTVNTECPSYLNLKQINRQAIQEKKKTPTKIINRIFVELKKDSFNKYVGTIVVKELNTDFELINESNSYLVKEGTISWLNEKIKNAKAKYPNWDFKTNSQEYKNFPVNYNTTPTPEITTPPPTNNQELLQKYSQATLISTNINIYSPRGKFRGDDIKPFEINKDLKSFGIFSDSLHPTIFGDETVRVLDLIIRLLLTHIHTPEMPLAHTSLSDELKKYTVDGWLQNLLSNHVRIN